MRRYCFKFWFEHGGGCIWSANEEARICYGYPVSPESLPISPELITALKSLELRYHSYLDWNCPQNPSPWTEDEKRDFIAQANEVYDRLGIELGDLYEVTNAIEGCVI